MHKYKNYVHLEGTAVDRAVLSSDESSSSFDLVIRDETRSASGQIVVTDDVLHVELWGRQIVLGNGIRAGASLIVDGTLKTVRATPGSPGTLIIKAHRVFAVDRTLNRRGAFED